MKLIVRTLLTMLMALTLNASMVLASTTHSPDHHTETIAPQPCDHHGHSFEKPGHGNVPDSDDCPRELCPSCTGLLLLAPVMLDPTPHFEAEPFMLDSWAASWRPLLFRPPIHI